MLLRHNNMVNCFCLSVLGLRSVLDLEVVLNLTIEFGRICERLIRLLHEEAEIYKDIIFQSSFLVVLQHVCLICLK